MMRLLTIGSVFLIGLSAWAQAPEMGHGRGAGGEGRFLWMGPGSHTAITGAPYSATETTSFQQTLSGGNQITRQQVAKIYRDSQGRVRMEHTRTPPGSTTPQTMVTIFDPVAGFSYMLNSSAKTVVKTAIQVHSADNPASSTHSANGAATRPNAQRQRVDLGKQTMNGVSATGTRVTETIPVGAIGNAQAIQVVRETWVSADLKVPVQITTTDPRWGTTTLQLTNIAESEPDATLFQVPTDYTVSTRTPGRRPGMGRSQQ